MTPELRRQLAREYRQRHLERMRQRDREYHAKRRLANPAAYRSRELRSWHSKRRYQKYGVTSDWFRDQLVGQAGRCAICGNVFSSKKDTHLDHSHETGEARGLLCGNCNRMIGLAKENPSTLQHAVIYLEATLCRADQTGRPK